MRRSCFVLVLTMLFAWSTHSASSPNGADDYPSEPGEIITDASATMQKVSDAWFGIVPDFHPATRFAADDLPESFRSDGLRVVFSGVIGEIPANQRLWGTPLELTDIRLLEE